MSKFSSRLAVNGYQRLFNSFYSFVFLFVLTLVFGGCPDPSTSPPSSKKIPTVTKLVVADADLSAGDQFGNSVAMDGNYAIVGVVGHDRKAVSGGVTALNDIGKAYVYHWNGSQWTSQKELLGDAKDRDNFGFSVAISGSYALVGALHGLNGATVPTITGAVYIFKREGANWSQVGKLSDDANTVAGVGFGESVAIGGDASTKYILVGVPDIGKVHNYKLASDVVDTTGGNLVPGTAPTPGDKYGNSLAISTDGTSAIVGAYGDNSNAGSVTFFSRTGDTWTAGEQMTGDAANDYLGFSVAISGNYALAGASGAGYARVYKKGSGETWTAEPQKLEGNGGIFGFSVGLSDEYAIVGANRVNSSKGEVYIFTRDGTLKQRLIDANGKTGDQFGFSVAIDGDKALVGAAYFDEDEKTDAGAVFAINGYK